MSKKKKNDYRDPDYTLTLSIDRRTVYLVLTISLIIATTFLIKGLFDSNAQIDDFSISQADTLVPITVTSNEPSQTIDPNVHTTIGSVTGNGTWHNLAGVAMSTDFNAHEANNGRPARGTLIQTAIDGSFSVTLDINYVDVNEAGSYACIGGYISSGSGRTANRVGMYKWILLMDGGEGTDANDYFAGSGAEPSQRLPPPGFCVSGNNLGVDPLTSGNFQIHTDNQ